MKNETQSKGCLKSFFKLFILSALLICHISLPATNPNTHYLGSQLITGNYCSSSATSTDGSKVDSVYFNTIANGSSGNICVAYSDFTTISTDVRIGFTYNLAVKTGTCGNENSRGVKVYIDWNADEDFYDAGEEIAVFGPDATSMLYNTTVTVPANAAAGATITMRVVCMETTDLNLIDPCGNYSNGETEDYTVNIVPRIITKADSVELCIHPNESVVIPITTENFYDVSSISLALNIDPAVLTYTSIQNIHPELLPGVLLANQAGSTVFISWINPFGEANIGTGTMFELVFDAVPGQCTLSWDIVSQGFCEYMDIQQNILAAEFIDGYFTGLEKPTAALGPDRSISMNECTTIYESGGSTGCSYLWSDGSTGTSIYVCPTTTTTYSVTITAVNGCTDSDEITINVFTKILTTASSLQECIASPGIVNVPITTENSWNVSGISLALGIDTSVLSFVSIQNIHPELQGGSLVSNQFGNTVFISWINPFGAANIGTGIMFELVFNAMPGQSQLAWDTISQGFCEYNDVNQNILPAEFFDGQITTLEKPSVDLGPDRSIFLNECTTIIESGCVAGCSYLWNDGSTTSSIFVCPTTTTTYSVTVTASNGCTDSDDITIDVLTKILTRASSSQVCMDFPGSVVVPIPTERSWNVSGISLALDIDASVLSFASIQNIHPELQGGSLISNQSGSTVFISWINPFGAANIGTGIMFELVFNAMPGQSQLIWDTITQGFCEYHDINQNVLPSEFISGQVTALEKPAADAGQDVIICDGSCVTLNATGTGTYLWSNGVTTSSNIVCPLDTTTYSVTVTALNGCYDTASVTVFVNPSPVANAGSDTTIYLNSCTDITATGAGPGGTYLWSNNSTNATIHLCPNVTSIYTVTITNIYGCTDDDDVIITVVDGPDITGLVYYLNNWLTPMNKTDVNLIQGGSIVHTTQTDGSGFYHFVSLMDGTYIIDGGSNKPWGGGNSADALIIMQHFVGIVNLTGVHLLAADVSADSIVNTLDALYVAQRFVGMTYTFPAGDWIFEKDTIVLAGQDQTYNFGALCFGDVNSSYIPPPLRLTPTIDLEKNGTIKVKSYDEFKYPISVDRDLNIGAISLIIGYPEELINVTGVELMSGSAKNLLYKAENGELRIAYYDVDGLNLKNDEELIILHLRASNLDRHSNMEIPISLKQGSELVDGYATVLHNETLKSPKLEISSDEFSLSDNHPNPFAGTTDIEFTLPEPATVNLYIYNSLGEMIDALLKNENKDIGTYTIQFDGSKLPTGVYFYKIEARCTTNTFIKSGTMIKKE